MKALTIQDKTLVAQAIVSGIETSQAARSKSTFYHTSQEQIDAVDTKIDALYQTGRELPIVLACQPKATGFFVQRVLLKEFKSARRGLSCLVIQDKDWIDYSLANFGISKALDQLDKQSGAPFVMRLLAQLADDKVNNDRSRRLILRWLLNHDNLEFWAVKYRAKMRRILTHLLGKRNSSILVKIEEKVISNKPVTQPEVNFVNSKIEKYTSKYSSIRLASLICYVFGSEVDFSDTVRGGILSEVLLAKLDITNKPHVPESVLLGLVSSKDHPQYAKYWSTPEKRQATIKMIRESSEVRGKKEIVEHVRSDKRAGVISEDWLKSKDPIALIRASRAAGLTEEEDAKVQAALRNLAIAQKVNLPYEKVGVLLDNSRSMMGSDESKSYPGDVAHFAYRILIQSSKNIAFEASTGLSTDLTTPAIRLIDQGVDAIFVLSDGYENDYDGGLEDVINIANKFRPIPVYHLSPIISAEFGATARPLSRKDGVIASTSIGQGTWVREALSNLMMKADPIRWLENEANSLLLRG